MPSMTSKIVSSFQSKYKADETTGCWTWTASTAGKGYGQLRIPGTRRNIYAHRFSYELHHGPIPTGLLVCHTCDNPRCVNPKHLFLGTEEANLQDMAAKDRHLYGERNNQHKLTEKQVHEIHDIAATGATQREIANMYGIGQMTVCRILNGERWKHVFLARTTLG